MSAEYDALLDLSSRFGNLDFDDLGLALQAEIQQIISDQFDGKYGPEGEPWPHNKTTPWYFDPNDTLRNSVSVGYGGSEIIVSSTHPAFAYQIYGTYGGSRIQEHPLIPEDIRKSLWGPRLDTAYHNFYGIYLGGGTGKKRR